MFLFLVCFIFGFIITLGVIGSFPFILQRIENNFVEIKYLNEAKFWVPLGVVGGAISGLFIWFLPRIVIIPIVIIVSLGGISFILLQIKKNLLVSFLILPLLLWAILFYSSSAYKPGVLIDGPYVSKEWNLATKTQYLLSDLPCDNVLPYIVSEFFVNKVPFKKNNTILPNQPVVNRGVISSLICAPAILIAGDTKNRIYEGQALPVFNYAGGSWPNSFLLYSNRNFSIFLGGYFGLLSMFFFAIFSSLLRRYSPQKISGFVLIAFSNYYILSQLVFTWPKIFTGLIAILLFEALLDNEESDKNIRIGYSVFLTALSFHFHPVGYYLVIILSVLLCMKFVKEYQFNFKSIVFDTFNKQSVVYISLSAVLVLILLWFMKFAGIEANLYSQNNPAQVASFDWLKTRLNSIVVFAPYPVKESLISVGWMTYLGSFFVVTLPLLWSNIRRWFAINFLMFVWQFLIAIPFGFVTPLMIIGMQMIIPLGIWFLTKEYKRWAILSVFALQFILFFIYVQNLQSTHRIGLTVSLIWLFFPLVLLFLWDLLNYYMKNFSNEKSNAL